MKKSPPEQRRHASQGDLWGVKHQWIRCSPTVLLKVGSWKESQQLQRNIGKTEKREHLQHLTSINTGLGNGFLFGWPKAVLEGNLYSEPAPERDSHAEHELHLRATCIVNKLSFTQGWKPAVRPQWQLSASPLRTVSVCQQQITASGPFSTISFSFVQTKAVCHWDDTSSSQWQRHRQIKHCAICGTSPKPTQ